MNDAIQFDLTQPWDGTGLSPADALLVEGLRAGEERAYEELIARFQQPVFNLVYRLVFDPESAGDVVQEVFLKVFRGVPGFRGGSSLKTWVYRIAVNEAHNHRRWFHRRKGQEVGLEDERGDGQTYEQVLADGGRSPFEIAMDHETRERIEQALQHVKPAYRAALILRDVEGLAYEEIAEILEVSLGTVKSRIVRGRESLRTIVMGEQDATALTFVPQGAQS
ncbi:MAG: sigma-70 family RNA polymerase sigma factor [Bryobacteraceae bacterium]